MIFKIFNFFNLKKCNKIHQTRGNCCICLDDILSNIKTTKCNHIFHKKCINNWLKEKNECPLCREFNPFDRRLTRQEIQAIAEQQREDRIRIILQQRISRIYIRNRRRIMPVIESYSDINVEQCFEYIVRVCSERGKSIGQLSHSNINILINIYLINP